MTSTGPAFTMQGPQDPPVTPEQQLLWANDSEYSLTTTLQSQPATSDPFASPVFRQNQDILQPYLLQQGLATSGQIPIDISPNELREVADDLLVVRETVDFDAAQQTTIDLMAAFHNSNFGYYNAQSMMPFALEAPLEPTQFHGPPMHMMPLIVNSPSKMLQLHEAPVDIGQFNLFQNTVAHSTPNSQQYSRKPLRALPANIDPRARLQTEPVTVPALTECASFLHFKFQFSELNVLPLQENTCVLNWSRLSPEIEELANSFGIILSNGPLESSTPFIVVETRRKTAGIANGVAWDVKFCRTAFGFEDDMIAKVLNAIIEFKTGKEGRYTAASVSGQWHRSAPAVAKLQNDFQFSLVAIKDALTDRRSMERRKRRLLEDDGSDDAANNKANKRTKEEHKTFTIQGHVGRSVDMPQKDIIVGPSSPRDTEMMEFDYKSDSYLRKILPMRRRKMVQDITEDINNEIGKAFTQDVVDKRINHLDLFNDCTDIENSLEQR